MIVVATLRVRSKHSEALKALVRALGAQIKLEAETVFDEIEDEKPLALVPVTTDPVPVVAKAAKGSSTPTKKRRAD